MLLDKQNKKMPEDNRYVDNRFQHQQQQNREQNQQLHTHGIKRLVRNNLLHFKRDCGLASFVLGLDRTGHMSFMTGQDQICRTCSAGPH